MATITRHPGGLSVAQLCTAVAEIRARVQFGAATIAADDPAIDKTQAVCQAMFTALDVILAPRA